MDIEDDLTRGGFTVEQALRVARGSLTLARRRIRILRMKHLLGKVWRG